MWTLLLSAILACLTATLMTPLIRQLAFSGGWMDHPGARRIHRQPTPRLGGVAVALGILAGLLPLILTHSLRLHAQLYGDIPLGRLMLPALAIFAVGAWDDVAPLPPWGKLTGQVSAGCCLWLAGVKIPLPQLAGLEKLLLAPSVSLLATVFWVVLCTNAVNLIDGIDGLATGISLIGAGTLMVAGGRAGDFALLAVLAPLAGALLGFLWFNFAPATIFLGDCGSLLAGFLLAASSILWLRQRPVLAGVAVPLLALALPLIETTVTVARRYLAGRPLSQPDLGHLHHRLLALGHTPRRVALLLYATGGLFAVLSFLLAFPPSWVIWSVIVLAALSLLAGGLHVLQYHEFLELGAAFRRGIRTRRAITQLVQLEQMSAAAAASGSCEQCWDQLWRIGGLIGAIRVELELEGKPTLIRQQCGGATAASNWALVIPVGAPRPGGAPSGWVRFWHPAFSTPPDIVVSRAVEILNRHLNRPFAWIRPEPRPLPPPVLLVAPEPPAASRLTSIA